MVLFSDALTLDAPRRTSDGYMAVRAKAARTGTYAYLGSEIDPDNKHGLRDAGMVNVLRDADAVFDPLSAHSFIGKPITDNHPTVAVNAKNWRDHARGTVMGAKWEEGGYLAFDLMLTDADTIDAVNAGKRELSNGYAAELQFGDFDGPGGVKCVAKQIAIKGNHVAIVDRGRAGPSCAIRDAATCESVPLSSLSDSVEGATTWLKKAIALHKKHMDGTAPTTGAAGEKSQMLMMTQMEKALAELEPGSGGKTMKMDHFNDGVLPVKTMLIDGLTVDVSNADTAEATIKTLITARDAASDKVAKLETQVATLTTDKATLEGKVKELTDAKPTPAQLRDAAKAYAAVVDKAKALGVTVTDAMDEQAIIKAAVLKHLGDAAASAEGWTDAQFASSFAMLKDAASDDPLRRALADGVRTPVSDSATVSTIRAARYA
tara:strand:+ start:2231 stop:3529 length:1299 start_codon:yes stop_codon:yes gene_type:complete